jgi:hypothetical protein
MDSNTSLERKRSIHERLSRLRLAQSRVVQPDSIPTHFLQRMRRSYDIRDSRIAFDSDNKPPKRSIHEWLSRLRLAKAAWCRSTLFPFLQCSLGDPQLQSRLALRKVVPFTPRSQSVWKCTAANR